MRPAVMYSHAKKLSRVEKVEPPIAFWSKKVQRGKKNLGVLGEAHLVRVSVEFLVGKRTQNF